MTEKTLRFIREPLDRLDVAGLSHGSLQPGGSVSLAFSDGIVQVTLDRTGDWTITAGLSVISDRLARLSKVLEDLGFFHATEQSGMIYHLWTTALGDENDNRVIAEETLLKVLKSFQSREIPSYIG